MSRLRGRLMLSSLIAALAFPVVSPGITLAAAPQTTPIKVTAVTAPPGWAALKANLDANPNLHKSVKIVGNTRYITYAGTTGDSLVLEEPAPGTPSNAVKPDVSVSGCFWFQVCVYLTHNELEVVEAGGGTFVAGLICLYSLTLACPFAAAVVASAGVYIDKYGVCPNTFRIEVWPVPLAGWSVGCW
jgi:hypothetical protein